MLVRFVTVTQEVRCHRIDNVSIYAMCRIRSVGDQQTEKGKILCVSLRTITGLIKRAKLKVFSWYHKVDTLI